MKHFVLFFLSCLMSVQVMAAEAVPLASVSLLPQLKSAIDMYWSDMPMKSFFGGQIEQETCPSLKSKQCWNPRAELKTSREYGFGLGQMTIAYNKDGTERFNTFKEAKAASKELQSWSWDDRYSAEMQLKSIVFKNKFNWSRLKFPIAEADNNRVAFLAVTYNAGLPITDVKLCSTIKGCDPQRWWNNVALHSMKSKVAVKGYGKSFYEISREYPVNVINVRRSKYISYLEDAPKPALKAPIPAGIKLKMETTLSM